MVKKTTETGRGLWWSPRRSKSYENFFFLEYLWRRASSSSGRENCPKRFRVTVRQRREMKSVLTLDYSREKKVTKNRLFLNPNVRQTEFSMNLIADVNYSGYNIVRTFRAVSLSKWNNLRWLWGYSRLLYFRWFYAWKFDEIETLKHPPPPRIFFATGKWLTIGTLWFFRTQIITIKTRKKNIIVNPIRRTCMMLDILSIADLLNSNWKWSQYMTPKVKLNFFISHTFSYFDEIIFKI